MISREKILGLINEKLEEKPELYLVDLQITPSNKIIVELDHKTKAVSIDECKMMSRQIEHNLDREVEDFALEVSSPGIDQPFKKTEQYHKSIGRNVKVAYQEVGSIEGELKAVADNSITIETKTKQRIEGKKKKEWVIQQHEIPFEKIKTVKLLISF